MIHVHSCCISNMKNIRQYLIEANVSSKHRVKPENIKSNDIDILN